MSIDVLDFSGAKQGTQEVPSCFKIERINETLIWEVVKAAHANKRQGTHKTKEKGEVRGGGAKPWKQKGTGRARAGSNRSPIWKGGGTIFGPRPRSYRENIPQKKKNAAFKQIIAKKINDNKIVVLDSLDLSTISTANAFSGFKSIVAASVFGEAFASNRKLQSKTNDNMRTITVVGDNNKKENTLSIKNIPWINLVHVDRVSTLPLFYNHGIVITKEAMKKLTEKFS